MKEETHVCIFAELEERNSLYELRLILLESLVSRPPMVERTTQNRGDRDALVFPVIFNYRQFIELSLKYLIATYDYTVGVDANWRTHDLSVLWKTLMMVVDGYGHDDPDQTDPIVAGVVAEFAKVDPGSFSYRYPVDIKGNAIPLAHDQLDLVILADVMEALESYFMGCDGWLDSLQSAGPQARRASGALSG